MILVNNEAGLGTLKYVPYFSCNKNCSPSACSQRDEPVQRVDDDSAVELEVAVFRRDDEQVKDFVNGDPARKADTDKGKRIACSRRQQEDFMVDYISILSFTPRYRKIAEVV